MTYDQAVAMCRDLDIPEDEIDNVIDGAELCNCGVLRIQNQLLSERQSD